MKHYEGTRLDGITRVTVNGRLLNPRFDILTYGNISLDWGYNGNAPAQLALALLADHLRDDQRAVALHKPFKHACVVRLPHDGWTLTEEELHCLLQNTMKPTTNLPGSIYEPAVA